MSDIDHEDFERLLNVIKNRLGKTVDFEEVRSIESNFDTKGIVYKSRQGSLSDGTIIAGEDKGLIAVDISKADGEVVSFVLKGINDRGGIENIIGWFNYNYK